MPGGPYAAQELNWVNCMQDKFFNPLDYLSGPLGKYFHLVKNKNCVTAKGFTKDGICLGTVLVAVVLYRRLLKYLCVAQLF